MLTPDQKQEYLRIGGVKCPYCGSQQLEGDWCEVDAGCSTQEVICKECGKSWVDYYKLDDVLET